MQVRRITRAAALSLSLPSCRMLLSLHRRAVPSLRQHCHEHEADRECSELLASGRTGSLARKKGNTFAADSSSSEGPAFLAAGGVPPLPPADDCSSAGGASARISAGGFRVSARCFRSWFSCGNHADGSPVCSICGCARTGGLLLVGATHLSCCRWGYVLVETES